MNVDAAGPSDDGKWGLAAVIRDDQGFVSAASCWCLPILPDSDVAEAMAMLKGLKFAKELLFLNIQAESDSSNVIMAIKDKHLVSVYLETLVEDCVKLKSSFDFITFTHVRRVANQAAHYLAKFALSSNSDFVWVGETPSCIAAVVSFDLLPNSA
jgi:ribonuclease HI